MNETLFKILALAFMIGGSVLGGLILSVFPIAVILKRNSKKYIFHSLIVCIVASVYGGIYFSLLAAIIMIGFILLRLPAPSQDVVDEYLKKRINNR